METNRLVFRFYQKKDFEGWQKLFSQMRPRQNKWDWETESISQLTSQRFANKLARHEAERTNGNPLYFCVEIKESHELVGITLLNHICDKSAEIGFQVSNKYWGQGLGKELAEGIINVARNLGLSRLSAEVNPDNIASVKILEKIGFVNSGESNQGRTIYYLEIL